MQRKELKKAIKDYSNKTNFYKLGLVKKFLKRRETEQQNLINAIPNVSCPCCNSRNISIDYDDREYHWGSWLYCKDCDETFDDTFGYMDAISSVECLSWSDRIAIELSFENPNIKTHEWKQFCEREIKKYLGIIKEDLESTF